MQQGSKAAICRWVFAKLFEVGLARRCILSSKVRDARTTERRHPTIAGWSASYSTAQSGPCGEIHPCSSSVPRWDLRSASDALTTLRYHRRQWHVSPRCRSITTARNRNLPAANFFYLHLMRASSLADASARAHPPADRRISKMSWRASPCHVWNAYLIYAKDDAQGESPP